MSFKNISANRNYIIFDISYIIRYNHNRLKQFKPLIDKIDRDEKLAKLKKLKQHEDFEKESENNS